MQELRFVAVSEDGSYAVLAVPGRSGRYVLPIDERLRAIANGQTSRLAQYEIEVESPLRPKEIQARIRAGETAEEIADAAGIPLERVRWFEGPVLAERAYIATQAQAASVRRAGDSGPGPRLGDIVPARLTASGADPEDAQWDSRKRGDGNWQVTLSFPSAGRVHLAEWVFDPRRRHAMPDDDNAARLSLPESELPAEPVPMPGEATVTPLAPRLGAAAGMGGGGLGIGGPGGFAGGGSGVGVRSFRPERSVIPDRSLGADRTLAAERQPVLPRPSHDRASHHDQNAFRDPAPAPYRDAPHREPVQEPAAYRDPAGYRDYRDPAPEQAVYRAPEPAAYREPVQEPTAYRAPAPERPARPRPVIFEEPEPAVIFEDPETTAVGVELATETASTQAPREAVTEPEAVTATVFSDPEPATAPVEQQEAPKAAPVTEAQPTAVTGASEAAASEQPAARLPEPVTETEPATIAAAPSAPAQVESVTVAAPSETTAPPETTAPSETTAAAAATSAAEVPAQSEAAQTEAAQTEAAQPNVAETTPAETAADATEQVPETTSDDQSDRPRAGGKRNAKGRRSSVPSWDEIMLGSSRQRD